MPSLKGRRKKRTKYHDHLGQEDTLKKEMATHFSNLAWKIPMDRGACWDMVSQSQT